MAKTKSKDLVDKDQSEDGDNPANYWALASDMVPELNKLIEDLDVLAKKPDIEQSSWASDWGIAFFVYAKALGLKPAAIKLVNYAKNRGWRPRKLEPLMHVRDLVDGILKLERDQKREQYQNLEYRRKKPKPLPQQVAEQIARQRRRRMQR